MNVLLSEILLHFILRHDIRQIRFPFLFDNCLNIDLIPSNYHFNIIVLSSKSFEEIEVHFYICLMSNSIQFHQSESEANENVLHRLKLNALTSVFISVFFIVYDPNNE